MRARSTPPSGGEIRSGREADSRGRLIMSQPVRQGAEFVYTPADSIEGKTISQDILRGGKRGGPGTLGRAGAFLRRVLGRDRPVVEPVRREQPAPLQPPPPPEAPREPSGPKQGQFLGDVFVNFAGMRQYRLYIP